MAIPATCITVIDETQNSGANSVFDAEWAAFRSAWPQRVFYLLDPGGGSFGRIPPAFSADPLASGPIAVARDGGTVANRSDWFAICGLNSRPAGSLVSLAVDTSGSMTLNTVRASYDYFIQRCADAGFTLVVDTTFPNERWAPPHNKSIPPSGEIIVTPASILPGNSATLTWNTSGEVSNVSINQGIGAVSDSGSRTVTPGLPANRTVTYTLTINGPGGTTTQSTNLIILQFPPPTINSFTVSPNPIVNGNSTTLSWNVTGNISSVSIDRGVGSVSSSGSRVVAPSSTSNYTLTATGPGGTSSRLITVTVYQPPQTSLTVDNASIIRGACTTLRWVTTGDATSATITPGIGSVNINGSRTVCPTETTTYQIYVTGLGGNDSDSVTLNVYQPPTVSLSGPESLNYGESAVLSYEATNTDISLTITPTYSFRGSVTNGSAVSLPIGSSVNSIIELQIPYGDTGPFSVTYTIVATGNGGQETKQIIIPINIDETPENFLVPESTDLFKDQDPVYTPDVTLTQYKILVTGIDIPIEIKADRPILVDVNDQNDWEQIRRIQ
jgi:hypothetical protein